MQDLLFSGGTDLAELDTSLEQEVESLGLIPFTKKMYLPRFGIIRERDASFDLSAKNWNCRSVVCA